MKHHTLKHIKKSALRTITTSLMIVVISLMNGCGWGETYYCKSYMQSYALYENIGVRRSLSTPSTKNIDLYVNPTHRVDFLSEGADKEMYNKICIEYGDTAYNREVFLDHGIMTKFSSYPHFAAISVISNKDFDAEHPAGTPLNDIMTVLYSSAKDYVDGGYTQPEYSVGPDTEKLLSELGPNDLAMPTAMALSFTQEPDELNIHMLTITCTDKNGRTLTAQINYDFRLPEGYIGDYENLK